MPLPSTYKRLQYIEASGTQVLDTELNPSLETSVYAEMEFVSFADANCGLFGTRDPSSNTGFFECMYLSGKYWFSFGNQQYSVTAPNPTGKRLLINYSKTSATVNADGVIYSMTPTLSQSFIGGVTLKIFALDRNGASYKSKSRVFSFRIYESGVIVRDFVPAKNSAGAVGLYDLINDKFHQNVGTGTFLSGPEVDTSYVRVEYIESTGTQYIDTGFKPNQNTRVVMDVRSMDTGTKVYFGARVAGVDRTYTVFQISTTSVRTDYINTQRTISVATTNKRVLIDADSGTFRYDSQTTTHPSGTLQSAYNMFLLAVNNAGTASMPMAAQLYSCQIYDNGTLVRNFVPCKNAAGTAGMLDLVNYSFYANAGSGAFSAGPELPVDFPGVSKVFVNDETIIDLTSDTVAESSLLNGHTAHSASGRVVVGTARHVATGFAYFNNTPTISGLPFRPKIVAIMATGTSTWSGSNDYHVFYNAETGAFHRKTYDSLSTTNPFTINDDGFTVLKGVGTGAVDGAGQHVWIAIG